MARYFMRFLLRCFYVKKEKILRGPHFGFEMSDFGKTSSDYFIFLELSRKKITFVANFKIKSSKKSNNLKIFNMYTSIQLDDFMTTSRHSVDLVLRASMLFGKVKEWFGKVGIFLFMHIMFLPFVDCLPIFGICYARNSLLISRFLQAITSIHVKTTTI